MHPATSLSPSDLALSKEFARRLAAEVDPRFFTVTLFGFSAREDTDEESDLDLFISLKEDDPQGEVKAAASGIACDLTLECGILVSVFVADKAFLQQREGCAFLEAVEEEGIGIYSLLFSISPSLRNCSDRISQSTRSKTSRIASATFARRGAERRVNGPCVRRRLSIARS